MANRKKSDAAPVEFVLGMRTIDARRRSYGGFIWPSFTGEPVRVEPARWSKRAECGDGIHFALWGGEDSSHFSSAPDAIWQVVRADAALIVDLDGKHKAPWVEIVFEGSAQEAAAYILANGGAGKRVHYATATAGNYGTATAGDSGTATAGHRGTATAGNYGTATAGYRGTATAGYRGTATAGNYGTATAGHRGTATAGYRGTATAGNYGTATAGDSGTATAGYRGTATAGNYGTATAGDGGTATAGDGGTATAGDGGTATAGHRGTATAGYRGTATAGHRGTISILWWDGAREKYRRAIAEVGENGIEPNVAYRVSEGGKLTRVDAEKA